MVLLHPDMGSEARPSAFLDEAAQRRQGVVLIEIIHDEDLMRVLDLAFDFLERADDVVAFVVDRNDDPHLSGHYMPPSAIWRLIQGMISSSAASSGVAASNPRIARA